MPRQLPRHLGCGNARAAQFVGRIAADHIERAEGQQAFERFEVGVADRQALLKVIVGDAVAQQGTRILLNFHRRNGEVRVVFQPEQRYGAAARSQIDTVLFARRKRKVGEQQGVGGKAVALRHIAFHAASQRLTVNVVHRRPLKMICPYYTIGWAQLQGKNMLRSNHSSLLQRLSLPPVSER